MYRMDYDSHGAGDRTIAAKCEGSHSGGGCNFAQFIDFIQKKRINSKAKDAQGRWIFVGNFDPSKVPADLDLENPDINKASEIMDWDSRTNPSKRPGDPPYLKYDGGYEASNLLGAKAAGRSNHGAILDGLAEVVQDSRKKAGDEKVKDQLENVRKCLNNVVLNRIKDNAANLVRDFQIGAR
ncbi:hypothetical protein BU26DRAFT_286221 [Trematosphaeria pertusa]|uniref:Uncharacterized protein n=1 Tax=Trematosphaeria pertusa TaxID=390896 RepID=A0A6A6ILU6_9PLEO|nr:uncharacterized protein BU26DRAFT_286221 [Trematosphaeria pertusa]KAF2251564.1 hypothetical protein BU26DRAFT_286221 [Trematosphaeria pertusa]